MREVSSLKHTRWECKYHIVFIPKYRRKVLFCQIRKEPQAPFMPLQAAHKAKAPGFAGGYLHSAFFRM